MKSLKDYSLNISEEEYHNLPGWNYSSIAKYAKEGFSSLYTLGEKTTPTASMEFGSLFDSIITGGDEALDKYVVSDVSIPEAEKKVLDELCNICESKTFEEIPRISVLNAADNVGYQTRWKPETRYDKISSYGEYYDIKKSGKKTISRKDMDDALEMRSIFRSDPYLKNLFGTESTDRIEYIYQAKFQEEMIFDPERVVMVKCMPDLIVVNHDARTIQPVDLKTSSVPGFEFTDNFIKYRYDIQAGLYTDILDLVKNKASIDDPEYDEYTILPYLFTDISRSDKIPVTYEYDPRSESQKDGFTFESNGKTYTYKPWDTLLTEILDYREKNAKVPYYIVTDGPNDLLKILNVK